MYIWMFLQFDLLFVAMVGITVQYQQKRIIRAHKSEGYLQLNPCAQRIAYRFGYIAAVDAGTITISL